MKTLLNRRLRPRGLGRTARRTRLTRTALVVALIAAAASVPAGAALALPPPGDGGEDQPDPIERPTTTRPPNATPPNSPRHLVSFSVTTDSVVATATIRYNGNPSPLTVAWGDGTTSSRCVPGQEGPLGSGCMPRPPGAPSDPPGSMVFQHVYAEPPGGAPFTPAITAHVGNDSQTIGVGVTPRYRVTQRGAVLRPLVNNCDTDLELYNEWQVERSVPTVPDKTWRFDWIGTVDYPLPDSQVSVELTAAQSRTVSYRVVEKDALFDDIGGTRSIDLSPLLGSRSVELHYTEFSPAYTTPCKADILADVDVQLLRPGLSTGPGNGP